MAGPQAFYCLWQEEPIRERLFALLDRTDICAMRLANSACCNLVTRRLFLRTHLSFTTNTFTKPSRVQALSRIGHHIEHLTFYLPHSDATFLPPLLHPLTGREISFLYTPYTSMASVLTRPKYGNPELGNVLTQQYPPLFHAATNVPSFLHAIQHLTSLRHLTIRCPGQDPQERYRRDIVDYALISLRIALERAPLLRLSKLSLSGVHPAAFSYLRHVGGFGAVPSAARRWRQIRKLYIAVDAWDFYGPSPGIDQLKVLDDYIRQMAPQLEKLSFTWLNDSGDDDDDDGTTRPARRGPCPIALAGEPLLAPPRNGPKRLFNEVTGPMSPLPPAPHREPMHFPRLRCLTLRNTTLRTAQLHDLVERHKTVLRQFDCENVSLIDGSWEEAFAPLLGQVSQRGSTLWSRDRNGAKASASPYAERGSSFHVATGSPLGSPSSSSSTVSYGLAAVASPDDVQISSPSAAVAAVGRDLLDMGFDDLESYLGLGHETPAEEVPVVQETWVPDTQQTWTPPPTIDEEEFFTGEEILKGDDFFTGEDFSTGEEVFEEAFGEETPEPEADAVAQETDDAEEAVEVLETVSETGTTFTTQLKKKHERRRRHHRHQGTGSEAGSDEHRSRSRSRSHSSHQRHRQHRQHGDDDHGKKSASKKGECSRSRKRTRSRKEGKEGKESKESKDLKKPKEDAPPLPAVHPSVHRTPPPLPVPPMGASSADDVFGPQPHTDAAAVADGPLLQPTVYSPATASPTPEALRLQNHVVMAEDADARSTALRTAREAVLAKLSREFHRRMGHETAQRAAAHAAATAAEAAASVAASARLDAATAKTASASSSLLSSLRWRERLFGDAPARLSHPHHRLHALHDHHESNSTLVPLIFSRA